MSYGDFKYTRTAGGVPRRRGGRATRFCPQCKPRLVRLKFSWGFETGRPSWRCVECDFYESFPLTGAEPDDAA